MINLYSKNLSKIAKEHGLTDAEIDFEEEQITEFLKRIEEKKQGFYKIVDDNETLKKVQSFANNQKGKYKHIVILGIGGSALGAICLQQALTDLFTQKKSVDSPALHVIDNIDPTLLLELEKAIDLKKTLFIVITKSGSTPETLAQFFYYAKKVEAQKLTLNEHFIVITDPKESSLKKIAKKNKIEIFDMPLNVGGRFSVLTTVGLIPAALIGLDIEALLEGAKKMRESFMAKEMNENMPFNLATIQYLLYKKNKSITVLFPYNQKLIKLADWYRQLLAESIGKRLNNDNKEVFVGITPINALGVTDQHSQNQLYNEGPNDKFFVFLKSNKNVHLEIPSDLNDDNELSYLKNISFEKLLATELQGTIAALTQNQRPNVLLEIDAIDEEHLGMLFMLFEASIAFLGEFFEINSFDQPGVELSKKLTKEMLTKSQS